MRLTENPSFTGLNDHLVAKFFPLKRTGDNQGWETVKSQGQTMQTVSVPLTQAGMELSMNWKSPFEGAGVESQFPDLAQMAQAGMFSGLLKAIGAKLSDEEKKQPGFVAGLEATAAQLVGRTGQTKLNSTQVFSGMPPVKIQVTAFFKAFRDPWREVEEPIRRLQEWALPQRLAPDGVIAEILKTKDLLSLMPSTVPLCIGFAYKGRTFKPMVIESISDPLDAPIDRGGRRVSAAVQMTLCSLTALDKTDWRGTYQAL